MANYKDPDVAELIDTAARQAVQITRLERDNANVHAELEALRNLQKAASARNYVNATTSVSEALLPAHGNTGDADLTGTTCQTDDPSCRYAVLQAKFAELEGQHKKCRHKMEDLLKKNREAKASCKAWKDYIDRHNQKQSSSSRPTTASSAVTPAVHYHANQVTEQYDSNNDMWSARPTEDLANPAATIHGAHVAASTDGLSGPLQALYSPKHRITSSQTTALESTPEPEPQPQPVQDDDGHPVVTKARSLKRRARVAASPERSPQRIKQEPVSSNAAVELSSDAAVEISQSPSHENPDAYDLNEPLITPPRNKLQTGMKRHSRSASCKPTRNIPTLTRGPSSRSQGYVEVLSHFFTTMTPERELSPHQGPVHESRMERDVRQNVLQPLSANVSMPKRRPDQRQKSEASQVKQPRPQTCEDRNGLSASNADHQLDDLLNKQTHERTPTLTRKALRYVVSARKSRLLPQLPTPASEIKHTSPAKRRSPAKRSEFPHPYEAPPPIHPNEEPLRNRSPETLGLDDFKINPNHMGTDFAFADTLRGRDARRNLQNCTRADYCGDALEKAVTFGGPAVSGRTDAQALEDYLGPDWENHIGAYGAQKRKDIVMQAHVHIFANYHGKHRQAFARRSTPPGFWETDFPTTQEAANLREQAAEMERKEVRERWRESLRQGGRWKFRDE